MSIPMRWPRWSALILMSWICVLLGSASGSSLPPKGPEPESPKPSKETHRADHYQTHAAQHMLAFQPFTAVPESQRTGDTVQHEVAEAEKRIADAEQQIAFFTRILAGAAILQFLVTLAYGAYARGQLREMRRQADLTRDIARANEAAARAAEAAANATREQAVIADKTLQQVTRAAEGSIHSAGATRAMFKATHRPKLVIRNVAIDEPNIAALPPDNLANPDLVFKGQVYVVNVGGTPATIKEAACWVYTVRGDLPMRLPYEGREGSNPIGGTVLPSGTVKAMEFEHLKNELVEGGQAWDKALAGEPKLWNLYLMGWVMYADSANVIRTTTFCRRWDIGAQRFLTVDNPDYENAD